MGWDGWDGTGWGVGGGTARRWGNLRWAGGVGWVGGGLPTRGFGAWGRMRAIGGWWRWWRWGGGAAAGHRGIVLCYKRPCRHGGALPDRGLDGRLASIVGSLAGSAAAAPPPAPAHILSLPLPADTPPSCPLTHPPIETHPQPAARRRDQLPPGGAAAHARAGDGVPGGGGRGGAAAEGCRAASRSHAPGLHRWDEAARGWGPPTRDGAGQPRTAWQACWWWWMWRAQLCQVGGAF